MSRFAIGFKILLWAAIFGVLAHQSRQLLHEALSQNRLRNAAEFSDLTAETAITASSAQLARKRGDYWLLMTQPADLPQALAEYRRAVELDPNNSLNWLALADVLAQLRQSDEAARAYAVADKLDPMNHRIQQAIGNFHLAELNIEQAQRHHARAIAQYPAGARGIYVLYWNLGQSVVDVAAALLSDDAALKRRYFQDSLVSSSAEDAERLWAMFQTDAGVMDAVCHRAYFDYLVAQERPEMARELWQQIAQTFYGAPWDEARELFWNGDLSRPVAFTGGLEWLETPAPQGMTAKIGQHTGGGPNSRAIHLAFDGTTNHSWSGISHGFFVQPGKSYALRFRVRTRDITTHNGPYIRLRLASDPPLTERSPAATGSIDEEQSIEFSAPEGTHWGEIRLCRDLSRKLNNKISGEAWFSHFRLEEIERPTADGN